MNNIEKQFYGSLDALKAEHGLPSEIRLAVYEDDESLGYFRPGEPWESNAAHTACMRSLAASAAARYGIKVELVTINTSEYWRWLAKRSASDSPEMRAEYINQ